MMSDALPNATGSHYRLNIIDCVANGWTAYVHRFGLAVGGTLLVSVVFAFPLMLMPGPTEQPALDAELILELLLILGWLVILFFLIPPISGGLYWLFLRIARDDNPGIKDLFEGFKRYGKLLGLQMLILAVSFAAVIPAVTIAAVVFSAQNGQPPDTMPAGAAVVFVVIFLALIFLLMPYTLVYYVLMDDRQIGLFDALRQSRSLLKGNYWRYVAMVFVLGAFSLAFYALGIAIVKGLFGYDVLGGGWVTWLAASIPSIVIGPALYVMHATVYAKLRAAREPVNTLQDHDRHVPPTASPDAG